MNYVLIDEGVPLIIDDIVLEIQRKTLATTESYIGFSADVNITAQTPVRESVEIDVPRELWARFHKEKSILGTSVNPAIGLPAGDYIVWKIETESFESLVTEALDKAR